MIDAKANKAFRTPIRRSLSSLATKSPDLILNVVIPTLWWETTKRNADESSTILEELPNLITTLHAFDVVWPRMMDSCSCTFTVYLKLVIPKESVIISPSYAAKTLSEILETLQSNKLDLSNYVENIVIKYMQDCKRASIESDISMLMEPEMKKHLLKAISIIISNSNQK